LWRIESVIASLSRSRLPIWLTPSAEVSQSRQPTILRGWQRGFHGTNVAYFGGCCGTDPSFVRAIAGCSNTTRTHALAERTNRTIVQAATLESL
jgi:hypothetical protein